MHRTVVLLLAVTFSPAVVAAQQPCTTDARQVESGRAYLGVNDASLADNTGNSQVMVTTPGR